ncbi:uncharacterized protein LOC133887381 [Phragmites australis]|uniref:uncharacterized protein LOC133887381 n=1 Tax=Phragmites australis TaxID=29695 RepID=UPI002D77C56E|nr:uncharacterized protein LOC133887381 [Phragmites australis]
MPLAAALEGVEASGSRRTRSSAGRRQRRSESLEPEPTPMRRRGSKRGKRVSSTTAAAVPVIKTHSTAASSWLRSKGMRMRSADAAVKERRRKRNRADDNCDDEEGREEKKRNFGEEAVPPSDASREEEEEEAKEEEEVSSAPSSPLCEPDIPEEVIGHDSNGVEIYKPIDSETSRAYEQSIAKFSEKLARQTKLPTLDQSRPSTCLVEPKLLHVCQSATRTVVRAGKFVFALSSSVGGKPLTQCTGFLIDWDQKGETGIILTSAHLIRSKDPSLDSWLCKDEYTPDAQVTIHFLDKTTEECHLLYYQKHYNIALFRTKVKLSVELPSFNDNVNCGQEVFMIGRDENSNLRISYGRVQYLNPNLYERYHFMYAYGAGDAPKCGSGGPVIDFDGKVVGMSKANKNGSFVPTLIILKWLHLWRNYGCIPRPHLRLKLWAIKFLDPTQIEMILFKCGTDDGLIVKEVSNGSFAEKLGIRVGDIIECLNGLYVSSTVELENMLLRLSEEHLARRNGHDSKMDVEIGIFCTRKEKRRTIKMALNVTDEGEEVVRGSYLVTTGKGVSASVLLEQVDSGSFGPCF